MLQLQRTKFHCCAPGLSSLPALLRGFTAGFEPDKATVALAQASGVSKITIRWVVAMALVGCWGHACCGLAQFCACCVLRGAVAVLSLACTSGSGVLP